MAYQTRSNSAFHEQPGSWTELGSASSRSPFRAIPRTINLPQNRRPSSIAHPFVRSLIVIFKLSKIKVWLIFGGRGGNEQHEQLASKPLFLLTKSHVAHVAHQVHFEQLDRGYRGDFRWTPVLLHAESRPSRTWKRSLVLAGANTSGWSLLF